MKILMILLSGVILVNNHSIDKTQFETITGTKVVKQGIVPVVAKKATSKEKNTKKVGKLPSKSKKKVVKKKKTTKKAKKVVKKKTTKKKVYRQKFNIKYNKSEIKAYTHELVRQYGWSEYEYQCLVKLWNRESSWNPNSVNRKSGACGLGQAYPCSKATKGTDYRTNWKTQVRWGLNYIKKRYGSPSEAWKHSQDIGWY